MKKFLIILLTTFVISSCGKKQESDEIHSGHDAHGDTSHAHHGNPKTATLMALHDSIMPRMGVIMQLKTRVTEKATALDSLIKIQSSPDLAKQKSRAASLIAQLDQADQSMMGWMHQYKADTLDQLSDSQQDAYVADQSSKMETVKTQVQSAIADSERFLYDQIL